MAAANINIDEDLVTVVESDESDDDDAGIRVDPSEIITCYFHAGFPYEEILQHLDRLGVSMSMSTLKRRLKEMNLKRRRNQEEMESRSYDDVIRRIQEIVDGPGASGGYRTMWHTLQLEGFQVPRCIVQQLLRQIDPDGTESRKRGRLRRRQYRNPGPNYAWHIDGYDKLNPWGFPIHGCIDGFSRRIMWLKVTRSNNSPANIARMYLNCVRNNGCPVELVTDLGTENIDAASLQSYFRNSYDAHRYVPSPRNQRIESWWSYFSRNRSMWWRNFFQDLERRREIDLTSHLSQECLWYTFSPLIQKELDDIVEHWNTHYIRRSRFNTIGGRPHSLYFLPANYGAEDMKIDVSAQQIQQVSTNIVLNNYDNYHTDYFDYLTSTLGRTIPTDWREAWDIYKQLMDAAQ